MRKVTVLLSFLFAVSAGWTQNNQIQTPQQQQMQDEVNRPYMPGLASGGISYLDVRQLCAIVGCQYAATETEVALLGTFGTVTCRQDDRMVGPGGKIRLLPHPLIFSQNRILVPSQLLVLLGKPADVEIVAGDTPAQESMSLVVFDTPHRIRVLDRSIFYNEVKVAPIDVADPTTPITIADDDEDEASPEKPAYGGGYYYGGSTSGGGPVQVKGYYRKDGTYVRPHTRSTPRRR